MRQKSILLVEDDVSLRLAIESFLSQKNDVIVKSARNVDLAKKELKKSDFDIVLSDVKMPGGTGFDLLEYVRQNKKRSLVILMTAFGTIEQAVFAMKKGAYDFIVKPFRLSTLENLLKGAFQDHNDLGGLATEEGPWGVRVSDSEKKEGKKTFITNDERMLRLIGDLKKVAASKATVLIQGESGTGKEVLANMIHDMSPRREKPFIAINCAALPDNLLESELFGHEKGSFTGAIQRQIGKFELSNGGTILLDEISEMSLNMQTKLLRVLQECEVYRVGGSRPIPLNLRVIASTNRDLYKYMKQGHFREDLYYRINVIPMCVPPLRERGDDVLILADYFLDEFAKIHKRPRIEIDELSRCKIKAYPWYGNVRELKNSMERAILVGNFDQLVCEQISGNQATIAEFGSGSDEEAEEDLTQAMKNMTLVEVERRVIYETLRKCKGNRTKAAEKLGISLRTLRNKLKTLNIQNELVFRNESGI